MFYKMLPLHEVIAIVSGSPLAGKKTWAAYNMLMEKFGSEFNVLIDAKEDELAVLGDKKLVELILLNREGKITVKPGFDGNYGIPQVEGVSAPLTEEDTPEPKPQGAKQTGLGDFC